MRRITLMAVAALAAPAVALGQVAATAAPAGPAPREDAWNLSVGTGAGSVFEFADGLGGNGPSGYDERMRDRIQVNVRADRELGRWLRAGLAYTYVGWTDAYSTGGVAAGTIAERAHVLMVDGTLRWLRSPRFELYSALAAGYGRWHAEGTVGGTRYADTQSGLSFQLRYVGLAVGNERVRAFADLGIGFEGLVVAGLTVRL